MERLHWTWRNFRFEIVDHHLDLYQAEAQLARLNLAPQTQAPVRIGAFRRDGDRYWAPLEGGVVGKAVVAMANGYLTYTVETEQPVFEELVYFPDSILSGRKWHSFMWSFQDREWDLAEDQSVRIGETRVHAEGECGTADPAHFPPLWQGRGTPRVCAAHHDSIGWWGICVPGPLPVCSTYFETERRRFRIRFDYLRPGCDEGFMPTVYLALPLPDPQEPFSVMANMWELSAPWRLEPGRDYEPTSFVGTAICHPWNAIQYRAGNDIAAPIPPATPDSPCNAAFMKELIAAMEDLQPGIRWNLFLPQGWYKNIGDHEVGENFGGEAGFRELGEHLRQRGHLLTFHLRLHRFNQRSKIGRQHPEWTAKLRPHITIKPYWSANEEFEGATEVMDVTRPDVRAFMRQQVTRFLSDREGMLNLDGVYCTGDDWPSHRDHELANNDYGVGDLLAYKINRDLFLHAKSVKPYAILGMGQCFLTPGLYGLVEFESTVEEHVPIATNTIRQLRMLTRLFPHQQLNIADYHTTRTKAYDLWPLAAAIGRPQIDNPWAFTTSSLLGWIKHSDDYQRRLRAVLAAYANAPVTADTLNLPLQVEGEGLRMDVYGGRRRTTGPLAGFYSALSFGTRTIVTYSDTKAVLMSHINRLVTVPLPPAATLTEVVAVAHTGTERPYEYRQCDAGLEVYVPDAAGATKLIEIRYELAPAEACS